jgi:hypothetical protein
LGNKKPPNGKRGGWLFPALCFQVLTPSRGIMLLTDYCVNNLANARKGQGKKALGN